MSQYCSSCGAYHGGQARFCPGCGVGPRATSNRNLWWIPAALLIAALVVGAGIFVFLARSNHKAVAGAPDPSQAVTQSAAPAVPAAPAPTTVTRTRNVTSRPASVVRAPSVGPGQTERAQGNALNDIIEQTASARQLVLTAIADIDNCRATSTTYDDLNRAITVRNSVVTQLANLQLSKLPGGAQLRSALQDGESSSAIADQHYLNWAYDVSSDCYGQAFHDTEFEAASSASQSASASKSAFVTSWNPVAGRLGLPLRTTVDL